MSTHSEPRPDAGPEPSAPSGGDDQGLDAAEAAGFGGITWADELEGDDADGGPTPTPTPTTTNDGAPEAEAGSGVSPGQNVGQGTGEAGGPSDEAGGGDGLDGTGGPDRNDVGPNAGISVEDLVQDLERVTVERDQYLDASRRLQAEFENYRKAVAKREVETRERANESLVSEILPVLDACDGAMASGATDVEPVRSSLIDALTKQGLERIDEENAPFDPGRHEAVMHEPDDEGNGPIVAEVMRAGYSWKGRVVRPAMVRVRG